MKAVILPLGLTLLLGALVPAHCQTSDVDTAVREAVYRQANLLLLQQKLQEAGTAQGRHDLAAAAKLYGECWALVQQVGLPPDAPETVATRSGVVAVRFELARAAQKRNDYKAAADHIGQVLAVDPANLEALEFKRANDRLVLEQWGRRPSDDALAQIPMAMTNKLNAATKVQDGRILLEAGKLDEAERKLNEAVRDDPQNQAAYYYLNLVSEARFKQGVSRRDVASRQGLVDIENAWATPPKRELLPVPNPYAQTNLVHTSKGRMDIYSKLDRIRLDEVKYDGLPLSEVIINLNDQAKRRDPEKRGINFIMNPTVENAGATTPGTPGGGPGGAVDPATGLPIPAAGPVESVDMSQILIKINPPLNDVRLADALDAIVRVADKPIKFTVEDYAVVFSPKGTESVPLHIRTFQIDPNTFWQGLEGVVGFQFGALNSLGSGASGSGGGGGSTSGGQNGQNSISGSIIPIVVAAGGQIIGGQGGGGGGGLGQLGQGGQGQQQQQTGTGPNAAPLPGGRGGLRSVTTFSGMEQVSAAARAYFSALGVDLSPPKSLFFNDRQGILVVRATSQDLDLIEVAIQALSVVPPQINIRAKFVEVGQDDSKALGFDWYLGNFLMNNQTIGLQGGTAPSLNGSGTAANPIGTFPGVPGTATTPGTTLSPASTDQLLTGGLRNSAPALATLTGVLTDPQFRVVLHALEQRSGNDVLSAPEVTIISGRQAQLKATEVQTIIVDYSFSQTGGGTSTGGGTGGGVISDKNVKRDFASVDPQEVLAKVAALPITEWSYKADAPTRHIGPMAQDFHAAFNVGADEKQIAIVDASGVALAAIKALNEKNEKLESQLKQAVSQASAKDAELEALKQRLDKLEQAMARASK